MSLISRFDSCSFVDLCILAVAIDIDIATLLITLMYRALLTCPTRAHALQLMNEEPGQFDVIFIDADKKKSVGGSR